MTVRCKRIGSVKFGDKVFQARVDLEKQEISFKEHGKHWKGATRVMLSDDYALSTGQLPLKFK